MSGGGQRRTLLDFILLSGGEGLSKVAGFFAFAYLARVLTKEGYGAVELAASFAVFFSISVDFGLGTIGAREVAADRDSVNRYAAWIPSARLVLALFAVPAMAILPRAMGQPALVVDMVGLFAISIVFLAWNQRWLFQGLEAMKVVAGGQLVRMIAFLLVVVLLVHKEQDVLRVGVAEIAAVAIMAVYFVGHQLKRRVSIALAWPLQPLKRLYVESSSVGLGQMVWAFNQQTPTVLIAAWLTTADVASFGAANRLFVSLAIFSLLYHFNLFPTLTRLLRDSREELHALLDASFRVTAWAGVLVALPIAVAAVPISQLVFGAGFGEAGGPLAIMVWGVPITLVSGHARWVLVAAGKQAYGLVAQLAGAAVTAALGLATIPRYGILGAAATNLVAAIVVWCVAQLYARRFVGPVPFFRASLIPALGVAAGLVAARFVPNAWLGAAVASIAALAVALILDRELIADVRLLAGARATKPAES